MSYARQMLGTYPRAFNVDAGLLAAAIGALSDCVQACNADNAADLGEQNVTEMVKCIRLCLDCADICTATAGGTSRQTEYAADVAGPLLQACVAICRSCGDECERHARMHEHCRVCAEACRRCEQACQKLLHAMTYQTGHSGGRWHLTARLPATDDYPRARPDRPGPDRIGVSSPPNSGPAARAAASACRETTGSTVRKRRDIASTPTRRPASSAGLAEPSRMPAPGHLIRAGCPALRHAIPNKRHAAASRRPAPETPTRSQHSSSPRCRRNRISRSERRS